VDLSIVVVNYNTKELLRNCLHSIFEEKGISCEIFVIDNASTDGSRRMVEQEFPQVRLLKNGENLGFAAANNQGIRASKGTYILLLNSDTVVLDGALEKMVRFADLHPEIGVLGCQLLDEKGRKIVSSQDRFPSCVMVLLGLLGMPIFFWKTFPGFHYPGKDFFNPKRDDLPCEVAWVSGAALMLRMKALNEIGFLDENFFMYYEDTDICYRFNKKGWKIYFFPQAEITHYYGKSEQRISQRVEWTLESRYYFFQKCYGRKEVLKLWLISLLGYPISIVLFSIIYVVLPSRRKQLQSLIKSQYYSLKWHIKLIASKILS